MGIRLAKTAGFCWGVRRAVNLALHVAHERAQRILTFGPLIHNRQALDLLRTKGIEQMPKEPDCRGGGPILIRAHGVTPEVKENLVARGFEVIDATCPHVARTQRIVERQAAEGFHILIVGDRGHAEVEGLLGYSHGRGMVIENPEDVETLPDGLEKVCVVAQTTQGGDRFERCVEAVRRRFENVKVFNTRCSDTNNRQSELFELARQVEAVIVVGGRGSANTTRLAELSRERGVPTWHIETADELPLDVLEQYNEIGVTAGASTPHWIIEQVVDRLEGLQRRRRPLAWRAASALVRLLVIGQVFLALGAAALALVACHLMRLEYRPAYSALPFFYLGSMHLLHLWATLPSDLSLMSGPTRLFAAHRSAALFGALLALLAAIVLGAWMGAWVFAMVALTTFAGAIYSFGRIPEAWARRLRHRHLHNIPGSKDLCVALAWAMMIVIVPWVHTHGIAWLGTRNMVPLLLTAAFVFGLAMVRSLTVDYREIEGDLLLGRETLPILVGRKPTHYLLTFILAALAVMAVVLGISTGQFRDAWLPLAPVVVMAAVYWVTYRQRVHSHLLWAFLLDLPFLVAGILALA
ncbi:MAG: 4-hydroxy-3-methylbut-2-enyl diphosphate reductase [Candidatus Sumerlaeia bacterium]|nr:4-hydroxy-3-methylbut-2-enyl diphosphate reductase [Candidatus Sumerlaeia bacterium]